MQTTKAQISTEHGSKYLQQLCKHFGHKVPVKFTPTFGRVEFSFGHCELTANEDQLVIISKSETSDLPKLEKIISSHLARFAFRENLTIEWQPVAAATN